MLMPYIVSRQTKETSSYDTIIGQDMIKAIAFATHIEGLALADTITCPEIITQVITQQNVSEEAVLAYGLCSKDWHKAQMNDLVILELIQHIRCGTKPKSTTFGSNAASVSIYLREWSKLIIQQNVLYRKSVVSTKDFNL